MDDEYEVSGDIRVYEALSAWATTGRHLMNEMRDQGMPSVGTWKSDFLCDVKSSVELAERRWEMMMVMAHRDEESQLYKYLDQKRSEFIKQIIDGGVNDGD